MIEELKQKLTIQKTLTLSIKVTPKSKKREISQILSDGTLKIKLKSAPEQNKANEELIEFLSEQFEVPEKCISIIKGTHQPLKTVKISLK